ncbi:MAG: hypothetical protein A3I61_17680 [Acidobacteria bacterium RIFCSPLOWO2_02_FULL_68_18]|nr:MAG: hypothetical protein A3I61_17680 [Acidobacteria bacterium RIFCSPLOWO2_02_FULL_68_18]OFW51451.1 MAG: hypothetical protein A3G77_18125 [Acidobacteria bacterium RIFCSPLOWO2_12_FULL_68_19]
MSVFRAPALMVVAAALTLAAASCGRMRDDDAYGGGTPTSPTPGSSSSAATITITSSGASPRAVTVSVGSRVTFVNDDSRNHDMVSDPHPEHSDCPPINDVGFLRPGQSKQTGNLNTRRTCGYHDHDRDTDRSLQGTITIQ